MTDVEDARQRLHEALADLLAVENPDEAHEWLLTDWVVAYSCAKASDVEATLYGYQMPGMTGSTARALGLMQIASRQVLDNGWET